MNLSRTYKKLLSLEKDSAVLNTAEGLIHWDMETMMPPAAVEQRSLQLSLLTRIHHKMSTDPRIGKLLATIQVNPEYDTLGQVEKRNVYLINKNYREQTSLPEKLVGELARQEAVTVNVWKKAKAQKNFGLFKPDLQKLLNLSMEAAEILMKVKESKTPYEALIDNFESKMTADKITATFNQLQGGLKQLLSKIQSTRNKPDTAMLHQPVPADNQRRIAQLLTQTLGYDTASPAAHGRIDETEHPFTTGYYDDVRITTHYYADNFASSIFSVLHESGHALYEQNLNPEWKYQPVGSACSYGVHESQSRFYENVIGRSKEFWTFFMPKLKEAAPSLANLDLDKFVKAVNKVEPSKIRIEADEVTYNLHIIVRFEIERDLFANKITVDELPQVWNQKYAEYLGVKVQDDSEGVMQDTHWASGLYGYFPSYALGNVYSGQITSAVTKGLPDWRSQLASGNLNRLNEWLKINIHSQSDLYDPEELIRKATGRNLNSEAYLSYLNEKYGAIYGF
ncbi:MAG TPA: carboxypeptidase M32 [Candidatus Limnocylindrales bacterium]|nr:carboxypeptidase M32 [Candidatus Limnocylindrales bacterium]